jgi:hypothetical protein
MLSSKLVRLIEVHWDPLTTRIIKEIRADTRLRHLGGLPEGELRDRARDILEHLGHWLTLSGQHELAHHFEHIGAVRHEEAIPLHEVVLAYSIIKREMIEYARAEGIGPSTMEIYAEEELQHCVSRFFDSAVYHVVRGYEDALPHLAHAHAAGKR